MFVLCFLMCLSQLGLLILLLQITQYFQLIFNFFEFIKVFNMSFCFQMFFVKFHKALFVKIITFHEMFACEL